ncbi:MAG: glutathione S-transferase family protein [Halieaceae bacterium]|jgi:glutathione S-transferase|nr:glutathione S-transferase family protein [Halieaceae bacterium]
MNNSMILHHYESSPYAEKIRLMFGLTDSTWYSLISPVWPPRSNIDPLSGGYRRIPVGQIGADIFCDSSLIANEISRLTGNKAISPSSITGHAKSLMLRAEGDVFFAAIGAIPPRRALTTMLLKFGPVGTYRFIKDRSKLLTGGSSRTPGTSKATSIFTSFLSDLEQHLSENTYINGDLPSVADFATYHPLWLHVSVKRGAIDAGPAVQQWFDKIGHIGHGQQQNITQADAFAAARDANPRSLPTSDGTEEIELGSTVQVAPLDYGVVPVQGELAAVTDERIILARATIDFGTVHVHFPREGYGMTAQ